jgi:hypothetical protein
MNDLRKDDDMVLTSGSQTSTTIRRENDMESHHLIRLQAEIDRRRELLTAAAERRHAAGGLAPGSAALRPAEADGPGHALRVRLGAAFVMAGEALLARDRLDDPCAEARHS